jgi:hypothetical protein
MAKKVFQSFKIDIPTAGTRVALSATITTGFLHGLRIKASTANTGLVFIGGSNVSSANGYSLAAGVEMNIGDGTDGTSAMAIDPTGVFFDTATNGNDVEIFVLVNG